MSNFLTKIPVALHPSLKLLPQESVIESVEWDGVELLVRWSNHKLETPYTYHFPWPLQLLKARRLPEGVAERKPRTPAPVITPPPVSVARPQAGVAKSRRR